MFDAVPGKRKDCSPESSGVLLVKHDGIAVFAAPHICLSFSVDQGLKTPEQAGEMKHPLPHSRAL